MRFSKIIEIFEKISTEAPCRPSISAVPRSWATNRISRTIYASRTTTLEVTHRPGLTQSPRNPRGQLVVFRKIIKIHRFLQQLLDFGLIEEKPAYILYVSADRANQYFKWILRSTGPIHNDIFVNRLVTKIMTVGHATQIHGI